MKRVQTAAATLILLFVAASLGFAQVKTTVADTIYSPSGALLSGTLSITNNYTFTAADGAVVPKGAIATTTVTSGVFSISLIPNAGSTPAGSSYNAIYTLSGVYLSETWVVPVSASPVDLAAVRTSPVPVPSVMVSPSQLPLPTSNTLGGVMSLAPQANEWIDSILPTGTPHASQPAFSNLSGSLNGSQLPSVINSSGIQDTGINGQVFNPKSAPYGAKGDGVTDDTTAIQNAINAAASVGGTVILPPSSGSYIIGTFLTMPNNVIFQGAGGTLNFTGNGGGPCTAAENPVNTGFIRWELGGNRFTGNRITVAQEGAGTCVLNVQDGAETSFVEIDHNNIIAGSTASTNTNQDIYMYAVDTIHIHDNILKDAAQMIVGGAHTWARIQIGPHDVISTGTNNSLAMIQTPGGNNCFQVTIEGEVFEGYGSTNGISSSCVNGLTISDLYMGDPSATGGTWVTASPATLIDSFIDPPSNGKALSGLFIAVGNYIYGTSLLTTGGILQGNQFFTGPSAGCYVKINQIGVVQSTGNTFNNSGGVSNSYCPANGLTPHPIVRSLGDMDSTPSGVHSGITVIRMANIPTVFASIPACTSDSEGTTWPVLDSTTNFPGSIITGSGTHHVLGYCNGTSWVVASGLAPTQVYPGAGIPISTGSAWGASFGVQGTDLNVLTSGTMTDAAGTSVCTDANGGATTQGCPSGGGGSVTSIGLSGTANQITVTGASPITSNGSWTLSFPSALVLPSTTTATTQAAGDKTTAPATDQFVGNSFTPVFYETPLTSLNLGAIATTSTTVNASMPAGLYRIHFVMGQTGNGSGGTCSVSAILGSVQINYTEGYSGLAPSGLGLVSWYGVGNGIPASTVTVTNTASSGLISFSTISRDFNIKGGTSLAYVMNVTTASNCATPPTVTVKPIIEGPIP